MHVLSRWLDFWHLNDEEDVKYIKDSQNKLKEVTGEFPVGVYFGRSTVNTPGRLAEVFKEMHKEQGTPKLLYSSEAYNDDVPYWVDLPYEKDLPDEEKEGMLLVVSIVFQCFLSSMRLTSYVSLTTMIAMTASFIWHQASLRAADSCMNSISNPHLICSTEKDRAR